MPRGDFYVKHLTQNAYTEVPFGFDSNRIQIVVDSAAAEDVQLSYDGVALDGEIEAGEPFSPDEKTRSSIYLKSASGGVNVRVWAF